MCTHTFFALGNARQKCGDLKRCSCVSLSGQFLFTPSHKLKNSLECISYVKKLPDHLWWTCSKLWGKWYNWSGIQEESSKNLNFYCQTTVQNCFSSPWAAATAKIVKCFLHTRNLFPPTSLFPILNIMYSLTVWRLVTLLNTLNM